MRALRASVPALLIGSMLSGCGSVQTPSTARQQPAARVDNSAIYRDMSEQDVQLANAALDRALERLTSGVSEPWRNPSSGNHGTVTPLETFRSPGGTFCRRYREDVHVAGRQASHVDVACRRQPAFWVPVSG